MVGSLLNNDEIVDLAEPFPHFRELHRQQLSEKRSDAHIRKIIATPSNRAFAGGVISVLGMIERLAHEPGKRLRTAVLDFRADNFEQNGVPGGHFVKFVKSLNRESGSPKFRCPDQFSSGRF